MHRSRDARDRMHSSTPRVERLSEPLSLCGPWRFEPRVDFMSPWLRSVSGRAASAGRQPSLAAPGLVAAFAIDVPLGPLPERALPCGRPRATGP